MDTNYMIDHRRSREYKKVRREEPPTTLEQYTPIELGNGKEQNYKTKG